MDSDRGIVESPVCSFGYDGIMEDGGGERQCWHVFLMEFISNAGYKFILCIDTSDIKYNDISELH